MHGRPVYLASIESERNVMETNNNQLLNPFRATGMDSVDACELATAEVAEGTDGFCSPRDGIVDALLSNGEENENEIQIATFRSSDRNDHNRGAYGRQR